MQIFIVYIGGILNAQPMPRDNNIESLSIHSLLDSELNYISKDTKSYIEFLSRMIKELKSSNTENKRILELVNRIDIILDPEFPLNAYARKQKYSDIVAIDIRLVLKTWMSCYSVAIVLVNPRESIQALLNIKKYMANKIAESARNGMPRPLWIPINFQKYFSDPFVVEGIVDVAVKINLDISYFIILHEIAHHILGHTMFNPTSLSQSRDLELEADYWAFRKMNELRISLYSIEWFFTILFTAEYIVRIYSTKKPLSYIISFYGVVDFLSIIPTYLSLILVGGHSLAVIRTVRLLRVFRIFKLDLKRSSIEYYN